MLRGLAPALHAIKLECQSETDSTGSSGALLDHFHLRWRVTGKPKGKSANEMFEWLSEGPLWCSSGTWACCVLSMMVLSEVKPCLAHPVHPFFFSLLLVFHLASARHCYLDTKFMFAKFILRPNSPVLTISKRRFNFSFFPWNGAGFCPTYVFPVQNLIWACRAELVLLRSHWEPMPSIRWPLKLIQLCRDSWFQSGKGIRDSL